MCLYWLVTALVAAWKDVTRFVSPRQSRWRSTHRDEVRCGIALGLLQAVERRAELRDQGRQARTFGVGIGELEVDVDTVQAVVLDQLDCAFDERGALGGVRYKVEGPGVRVRPASDGEDRLDIPVRRRRMRYCVHTRGLTELCTDRCASLMR